LPFWLRSHRARPAEDATPDDLVILTARFYVVLRLSLLPLLPLVTSREPAAALAEA
jgi:hypothetical protein